ncbi:hypothetical protein E7Y31_19285, partial [Candidatus Frankia alpina]
MEALERRALGRDQTTASPERSAAEATTVAPTPLDRKLALLDRAAERTDPGPVQRRVQTWGEPTAPARDAAPEKTDSVPEADTSEAPLTGGREGESAEETETDEASADAAPNPEPSDNHAPEEGAQEKAAPADHDSGPSDHPEPLDARLAAVYETSVPTPAGRAFFEKGDSIIVPS